MVTRKRAKCPQKGVWSLFFFLRGWKSERASVLMEEDVEEKINFLGVSGRRWS